MKNMMMMCLALGLLALGGMPACAAMDVDDGLTAALRAAEWDGWDDPVTEMGEPQRTQRAQRMGSEEGDGRSFDRAAGAWFPSRWFTQGDALGWHRDGRMERRSISPSLRSLWFSGDELRRLKPALRSGDGLRRLKPALRSWPAD